MSSSLSICFESIFYYLSTCSVSLNFYLFFSESSFYSVSTCSLSITLYLYVLNLNIILCLLVLNLLISICSESNFYPLSICSESIYYLLSLCSKSNYYHPFFSEVFHQSLFNCSSLPTTLSHTALDNLLSSHRLTQSDIILLLGVCYGALTNNSIT